MKELKKEKLELKEMRKEKLKRKLKFSKALLEKLEALKKAMEDPIPRAWSISFLRGNRWSIRSDRELKKSSSLEGGSIIEAELTALRA